MQKLPYLKKRATFRTRIDSQRTVRFVKLLFGKFRKGEQCG